MYEDLVNELRHYFENVPLVLQAADAIEELSHENESLAKSVNEAAELLHKRRTPPKWISMTERLPEDKERVLIFYWLSTKPKIPWCKVATFSTKLSDVGEYDLYEKDYPGFYGSDSEYGYYEHTDVTHWMPLPAPPKEEADV